MKILVTGASGFIGSFIVEEGLKRGHQVWAGMRNTSSKKYLTDPNTKFAELDFAHPEILRAQMAAYKADFGGLKLMTDEKEPDELAEIVKEYISTHRED